MKFKVFLCTRGMKMISLKSWMKPRRLAYEENAKVSDTSTIASLSLLH